MKLFLLLSALYSCSSYAQSNIEINASGRDGRNAQNGNDGSYSGESGTSATRSTPGAHARSIVVHLQNSGSQVQLTGKIIGNPNQEIKKSFTPAQVGMINLDAHGGRGGNGGHGGNGAEGSRGSDGSNATQYSSGGSGGNGGSGGDGGDGTNGSYGGDGGNISVETSERDTQLLMLIGDANPNAGAGGEAGRNGSGGNGGRGGSGGSGYSWTESVYTGTDSKGNSTYRTDYHSNPGGSDGSPGANGSDGRGNTEPGENGHNGVFKILVGDKSYSTRYDLQVLDFTIDSENHDQIIEPGEVVTVSNIRIRNTGGMPTPAYAPLKIFLRNQGWVVTLPKTLKVVESLQPGQIATVEGELKFRVSNEGIAATGAPLNSHQSVSPRVNQTGVNRDYLTSETPLDFQVKYPLEITPIKVPRNLGPGQSALVSWKIKNISSKEYGKLSNLKRVIENQLQVNLSKTTTQSFRFEDVVGKPIDLNQGYLSNIDRLAPGESITIEGRIEIPKNAEVYQKVGLDSKLSLGSRTKGADAKLIQTRQTVINISYVYHRSANSDVVLVTNHDTKPEELKSWFHVLKVYGLKSDVWDLSYEGGLNLEKETNAGSTLAQDLRGKLLIVLNNQGEEMLPSDLISRQQIIDYSLKNQIHVHFIGEKDLLGEMNDLIVPFNTRQRGIITQSEDALVESIQKNLTQAGKTKSIRFLGETIVQENDYFAINPTTESNLAAHAKAFEERLRSLYPAKRFIVRYSYQPKLIKDGVLVNRVQLGKMDIYETFPDQESYLSTLATSESGMHSESFIVGSLNERSLLTALPLDKKLKVLKSVVENKLPLDAKNVKIVLAQLRVALLSDIALEQKSLRKKPNEWFGLDMTDLSRFETLSHIQEALLSETVKSAALQSMEKELLSSVYQLAKVAYSDNYWFRNALFAPTNNQRLVSKGTKKWVLKTAKSLFEKSDASRFLEAVQIKADRASESLTPEQRAAYLSQITSPIQGMVRDSILRDLPQDRILSDEQLQQILDRNSASEATRAQLLNVLSDEKQSRN